LQRFGGWNSLNSPARGITMKASHWRALIGIEPQGISNRERYRAMRMMTRAVFAPAMLASVAFFASAARADDSAVDRLYGEGVHAYFANDVTAAHKHLEASIAAGNRDPRCFYYRGLAAWKLGKADAAKADFRQGATLEAQSPDLSTMINRSMQRVQGTTRLSIEKFRSDAQLAALAARKQRDTARYGTARASAIAELEKQAAGSAAKDDILSDAATDPAASAEKKPAAAATDPATNDPFGDEAAADPMGTDAAPMDPAPIDPGATDPAAPMEEMPMEEAPATDPMAEPMTEEPKAEEPKAEEPAAEEPKPEEPAAEAPMTEEPKAEEPGGDLFD
jgi:hypothetical protein